MEQKYIKPDKKVDYIFTYYGITIISIGLILFVIIFWYMIFL